MGREGCQEVQEKEIQSLSTGEEQPVHQQNLEICFAAQENMGIEVENKLTVSQQCTHVTKKPTGCWAALEKVSPEVKRGVFTPLYSSLQFQ